MHTAQLVLAGLLSAVFAWSGIAKLRDPTPAARAMVEFGVTRRTATWPAALLGAGETAIAAGIALSVRWVLAVALLLVLGFTALVARALWRGARFPCACFGDDAVISNWTLTRNVAIVVGLAGLLATGDVAATDAGAVTTALMLGILLLCAANLIGALRRHRPFRPAEVDDRHVI
jgi:hypothetical protein